jgi:hypothetical protein
MQIRSQRPAASRKQFNKIVKANFYLVIDRTPQERTDKGAGQSGREVMSLQKVDSSLIVFLNAKGR